MARVLFQLIITLTFTPFTDCVAGEIHAIIVADTDANPIQKSVENDLENIHKELLIIADHCEMSLTETIFSGNDTNPRKINQYASQLVISPDDIVIIYCSGHGYRLKGNGNNPWPMLALDHYHSPLHFSQFVHRIIKKKPQFIFAMIDCCNKLMGRSLEQESFQTSILSRSKKNLKIKKNYQSLFKERTGLVMTSSSKPGEYSWSIVHGGLYTLSFLRSLHYHVKRKNKVQWDQVLHQAAEHVVKFETPQFVSFDSLEEAELFIRTTNK